MIPIPNTDKNTWLHKDCVLLGLYVRQGRRIAVVFHRGKLFRRRVAGTRPHCDGDMGQIGGSVWSVELYLASCKSVCQEVYLVLVNETKECERQQDRVWPVAPEDGLAGLSRL